MSKPKPKTQPEAPQPPDASIGHELAETRGHTTRTGTVLYWEYTGSVIRNMKTNEEWPAFRFRMRGKKGAEWWSGAYADKTKPRGKSLDDLLVCLTAINKSRAHAASWSGMLAPYITTVEQLIAEGKT